MSGLSCGSIQRSVATDACRRPRQRLAGNGSNGSRRSADYAFTSFFNTKAPRGGRSRARQSGEEAKAIRLSRPTTILLRLAAAGGRSQKKLDEQPEPVVEPKQPRYEEDDDEDLTDDVNELELQLRTLKRRSQGTDSARVNTPMPSQTNSDRRARRPRRERGSPPDGSRMPREPVMVERSNNAKQNGITGEEMAFWRIQRSRP